MLDLGFPLSDKRGMDTETLRAWIDAAGASEVAQRCGVGLETVGRWAVGRPIPKTRTDAIAKAHAEWQQEQVAK